jgi:hypothetical protein
MQQAMHQRGVLYAGYHVVTYMYTDALIDELLQTYDQVFSKIQSVVMQGRIREVLKGGVVQPVFRRA